MNNKTVTGLKLKHFMPAFAGSAASFICLFLPYACKDGKTTTLAGTAIRAISSTVKIGTAFVLYMAVLFTVFSLTAAVASYRRTTVRNAKIWQYLQAAAVIFETMLLFVSKNLFEGLSIYEGFLNSYLHIGFWLGLIAAYFALIKIMRMSGTNTGYIVLTVLSIIWLFPVLWIVLTAFRREQGYYVGYFIPHGFTIKNFTDLFTNPGVLPFGRWWVNTLIVASCGCIINTMIVLGTAFVLSRTRFKGRRGFMNILMIIGMFPGFMSLIAVYNILKGLGLNQSLAALIIVSAAGAAMGYHVTKGFFDTIPKAIDEAAIIDGATRLQIFTHITLPLSKSIIVYVLLGAFTAAWSDYIFPSMLFGDKQSSYTVAVGLYWMTDFRRIDSYYTQFAAGALVVAIPIVILFVWLQRFYVEGLSGAVKG